VERAALDVAAVELQVLLRHAVLGVLVVERIEVVRDAVVVRVVVAVLALGPHRSVGSQIVIRDNRWLVVADRERTIRRMYDDDEEVDDDVKRYDNIAGKDTGKLNELSLYAGLVAGGTVPEFGADGAVRPKREDGDDDTDNDGIPNDFDPFDNEHPQDGVTKKDLQFDGRYVEGGPLHPITIPQEARK